MKKFTKAHRRALEEYADLKISLEELRQRLAGVLEFDFQNHERRLDSHYGTPVPGVRIELGHIRAAMEKQARGEISTEELADWATMLLLNDGGWPTLDDSGCGVSAGGACDLSRRCTHRNSPADGWSVTETTMRTVEVVMLKPGREMLIAFL